MQKRTYDSTVARIAGNIASGFVGGRLFGNDEPQIARVSVAIARLIIAETQRTEPAPTEGATKELK
jgi:hypothetical protein